MYSPPLGRRPPLACIPLLLGGGARGGGEKLFYLLIIWVERVSCLRASGGDRLRRLQ